MAINPCPPFPLSPFPPFPFPLPFSLDQELRILCYIDKRLWNGAWVIVWWTVCRMEGGEEETRGVGMGEGGKEGRGSEKEKKRIR